jgi:predicted aldo/keto reductase-like oxidoreductase
MGGGDMTRREFLDATVALIGPSLTNRSALGGAIAEVPRRKLGRTGQTVSCIGLGGMHVGTQDTVEESIRIVRRAIDAGMNFLDNAWDYHGGHSELCMGRALRDGYRQKVFLMTKFDGRTKRAALAQLDESLLRLRAHHVDLWQVNEVIREDDPDRIFAEGGAFEAMLEAKKVGKVRFLGFSGHKSPKIHLKMLALAKARGFRFDAVQMPLNVMDASWDSFEKRVLPELLREGIGVLGMRPLADPLVLVTKTATEIECLTYALSLPVSTVIADIGSTTRLEEVLRVARNFTPPSEKYVDALLAKTVVAAQGGDYEKYKTTRAYDATWLHPEWLG